MLGLSKDEYFLDSSDSLEPSDEQLRFISLTKRDTEPESHIEIPQKKPEKKKASEKDELKKSTVDPSPKTSEANNKASPTPTSDIVTTDLPDLPSDLPTNLTIDGDVEGNHTQHFVYYNATFNNDTSAKSLWVDIDKYPTEKVITHLMLSSSHRRAATITLPFDFPFYGHKIRNLTIATGGFLYTGDYMHTWLAATQYIAPLMANFDTSINNESTIKYGDGGDNFTVQWENVCLQDKANEGPFTFQVTLHKSGDVAFVYKTIPISISKIDDDSHPVKVGLSDAYIIEKMVVFIRRKTIYEYHRADVSHYDIQNDTSIYFTALPTCQNFSSCAACMNADTNFECVWCGAIDRCSSGLDRHRQDWMNGKCEELKQKEVDCKAAPRTPIIVPDKTSTDKKPLSTTISPVLTTSSTTLNNVNSTQAPIVPTSYATSAVQPKLVTLPSGRKGQSISVDPAPRVSQEDEPINAHKSNVGAGAVISILIIICSVLGFGIWIAYAYKYPQSPSGQLLIRYRPSQWRWRHGEARYTAASIHI